MQKELIELELKYGSLEVDLPKEDELATPDKVESLTPAKQESSDKVSENSPLGTGNNDSKQATLEPQASPVADKSIEKDISVD